jgi:phosphomannomutase
MLDKIIKAYDIRGLVKNEITPEFSFSLGVAFAKFLEVEREPATILVGEDMRDSSPVLAKAFCDGATSLGIDVLRIGLCSTDMLYFASGKLNLPGIMFTASHNPAKYNGMKLCKSGARPIGKESGLQLIREFIERGVPITSRPIGKVSKKNLLSDYVEYLLKQFPKNTFTKRKLKVVIDAGNGMAGFTAPAVMQKLNIKLIPMYFELDGNFPNHEANPIESKNLKDLQKRVKKEGADIGLAFDGDADRCFLIDENGNIVNPSGLTALIATRELKKNPKSTIIYNLISSKSVPEVILENKGKAVRSRVGHSYIKTLMAETDAVFAGEHSGHFYFKNFWRADSGMLAALYVLAELMNSEKKLSELLREFDRYYSSGEINTKVKDTKKSLLAIKKKYSKQYDIEELDGLTVTANDWWFNLRPSNTEPLLRLNVEANTQKQMKTIRDEVLALVKR